MRTSWRPSLAVASLLLVAFAPGVGHATSRIIGIPAECTMTTYSVTVDEEGKGAPPVKLESTDMNGGWAICAYELAPDGKRILHHRFNGIALGTGNEAPKEFKLQALTKAFSWSPDSKHVMFWAPQGLGVADLEAPGEAGGLLKTNIVWKGRSTRVGWSPNGSGIYMLEQLGGPGAPKDAKGTVLKKLSLGGGAVEVLRTETQLVYFAMPTARFEYGAGASSDPFHIVLGSMDALYRTGSEGGELEKLRNFKPDALQDIVMSPDSKKEKLLLRLNKDQMAADGKSFLRGVLLAHLDRWTKGKVLELEQVSDKNDAHTLWFSPTGKYATWATPDSVVFRDPDGKAASAVTVPVPEKPIKGCRWNRDESRLAIAAGNRLYVYVVATKKLATAADLGAGGGSFVADPTWRGDDIVFTQFVDTKNK